MTARKDSIHPKFQEIEVIMTDGSKVKTRSTVKDKTMKLDVDPLNHPAWQKDSNKEDLNRFSSVQDFADKYGDLEF